MGIRRILNYFYQILALTFVLSMQLLSTSATSLELPQPFVQEFKSTFSGLPVSSKRSLTLMDDGRYKFHLRSRNLVAKYEETSYFKLDDAGNIMPLEHRVKSRVFGVSRREKTMFDWESGVATYTRGDDIRAVDIKPGMLDRTVYQLLIPEDLAADKTSLEYNFVDRGRVKNYVFEVLDQENVELVKSDVEAIKIRRASDNLEKETLIWFAPEHDYQLVKISHRDKDGSDYHMLLKDRL